MERIIVFQDAYILWVNRVDNTFETYTFVIVYI